MNKLKMRLDAGARGKRGREEERIMPRRGHRRKKVDK